MFEITTGIGNSPDGEHRGFEEGKNRFIPD
jgi:hypothetical protein